MNRPLIIILILLFLAFLFLGARYIANTFCGAAPVAAATTNNGIWAFDDGKAFNAESNQYYRFARNGFNFIPGTTESFKSTIGSTVDYLKGNNERSLTVTGNYSETEKYSGNAGNLGLARANDIKASLVKMGIPASQINTEARILRDCLLYTSPSPRDATLSRMPSSA